MGPEYGDTDEASKVTTTEMDESTHCQDSTRDCPTSILWDIRRNKLLLILISSVFIDGEKNMNWTSTDT